MSRATAQMRNFARRLISYEALGNESSGTKPAAAFGVCEKLRAPLITLMGTGGFRALLLRALILAKSEVPWLRAVNVKADGSIDWEEALYAKLDPNELSEGRVVLV